MLRARRKIQTQGFIGFFRRQRYRRTAGRMLRMKWELGR
ncbi:hypothetical protein BVG79_01516 [Ketogulonicigenium robustum]|uniref:Uncharacterized protein n=1 Tax=Ketogulonicigenium robustum TaxID=92947 RepID=A0A1W6P019_9RHOB|nr:hypothetical protein BVG79_01516 [Ketogulonicigenium robustum]